jgi:hypothetical protein
MPFYAYFHTTDGKVKFFRSNHRMPFPSSKHKGQKTTIDMSDPPLTEEMKQGKSFRGIPDGQGDFIEVPTDSYTVWIEEFNNIPLSKSLDSLMELRDKLKKQAQIVNEQYHELRKQMPTEYDFMSQKYDESGLEEAKLEREKGLTREDLIRRAMAEAGARRIADSNEYRDVIFDLRDPKNYDYVKGQVEASLVETQQKGFYSARVRNAVIYRLMDKGIRVQRPRQRESRDSQLNTDNQSSQSEEDPERSSLFSQYQTVIWSENFEGAFPTTPDPNHPKWYVDDFTDFGEGKDYWGKENCNVRSGGGSYSLWCAGIGTMPACQYYNWYMGAFLEMTNGVDLSNVDIAEISWWMSYDIAPGDYCSFWESEDGLIWYWVTEFTGTSNGWQQYTSQINSFYDNYYIRLEFVSGIDPGTYEGFYIDDIAITGEQLKPDLEIDWPGGWSDQIVVDTIQLTNTSAATLYDNEPCYIDWAIMNNGDFGISAGSFHVTLYSDDVPIHIWSIDSLGPWPADTMILDYVQTLGSGFHTLKLKVDSQGEIDELDENNNEATITLEWIPRPQPPNLTYFTPTDWDGPIVLSSNPNGQYETPLWTGVPTFIDFAVINTGGSPSGSFSTRLLIDGSLEGNYSFPNLDPGAWDFKEDITHTFNSGQHVVEIQINPGGSVIESNYVDNDYQITRSWQDGAITVAGEVEYLEVNGNLLPTPKPVVGYVAELWDADPGDEGDQLATATTTQGDYVGEFYFQAVSNIEEDGTKQDIFVKIYSVNEAAVVGDSISPSPPFYEVDPFYFSSDTIMEIPNGFFSFSPQYNYPWLTIDTTESGFFFIADVIRESYNNWQNYRPNDDPGPTKVLLRTGQGTIYIDSLNTILVEPQPIGLGFPDTFDKDIIAHEFGHRLEDAFSFFDSADGTLHSWQAITSLEQGSYEGFCNFWSCLSRNDTLIRKTGNSFNDTFWVNIESGLFGQSGSVPDSTRGTANALGKTNEGAVAGMLWDIFDNQNDDTSGRGDWGDTLLPDTSDSIGDTLSLGAAPIFDALFRNTTAGHQPDNINDFWETWFLPSPLNHPQGMLDIWYEHGDDSLICIGTRGDVNADGNEATLLDLNYLVNRIFRAGPPSPRPIEADVNADGLKENVIDLNYIVNILYRNGPPPPACP